MQPRWVSFHYKAVDKDGNELDSSFDGEPLNYVEGAEEILPALEKGLLDCKQGEKRSIEVGFDEAYGDWEEDLVLQIPRENWKQEKFPEMGDEYEMELPEEGIHNFRVIGLNETHVFLDGNHPLAGIDLTFEVEVETVREARPEELAHIIDLGKEEFLQ
jgi:FKBP-type peptidyl-prolyl cis-trans isomerase SlyD